MTAPTMAEAGSEARVDAKRFVGGYMVFKLRSGRSLSKRMCGANMPWYRHATLESAEAEAIRLNAAHPDSTFVIMQEVMRVKTMRTRLVPASL